MRGVVRRDLSASATDFESVVWPAVRDWCGGGALAHVEASTDRVMASQIDVLAGIDAWQIMPSDGLMRGIASRVQWGDAWDSFTIRMKRPNGATTEMEKRIRAYLDESSQWLHPALVVQAYLDKRGGELQHAIMARASDVYGFVLDNFDCVERRTNGSDGVEFVVLWACDLEASGARVRRWTSPGVRVRQGRPCVRMATEGAAA